MPENAITKDMINAVQHLEMIRSTQENWVWGGISDKNGKPISHNVSCTVVVDKDEWPEVVDFVYNNREYFAAVSFIGKTGDKDFPQCPNIKVQTPEDWDRYHYLLNSYIPVDYSQMFESEDTTKHTAEAACAGGQCEIVFTG